MIRYIRQYLACRKLNRLVRNTAQSERVRCYRKYREAALKGLGRSPSGELWAVIADHPSYIVSDRGRVRHCRVNAPILAGDTDPKGYRRVGLDGRHVRVARLVCEAFHGPCPTDHECAHLDGNKDNNSADNLQWHASHEARSGLRHPVGIPNAGGVR